MAHETLGGKQMSPTETTAVTRITDAWKPEKMSMVRVANGYGEKILARVIVVGRDEIGCALKAGAHPLHWFRVEDRGITWQPAPDAENQPG